jgi:hypothetical protein
MKKLFLAGVAALFLATGTARADEFVILIQKGDEKPSTAFATTGMSCAEVLESHEETPSNSNFLAALSFWFRGLIRRAGVGGP